jgi:DNA-binding protein HU-beta
VNRRDLVNALVERNEGLTRKEVDAFLGSFTDVITETVATGEVVAISGFVKFARVDRGPRMGRNPATGEAIKIKASRRVRVTPLKAFKDAVMSGKAPRKAAAKKTTKKAPARKAPAKKAATRKAPAKKTAARKAPAKKKAAKKATRRR